jgi:hypothetical protein
VDDDEGQVCRQCFVGAAGNDGFCSDVCRDAWEREIATECSGEESRR